MHQGSSGRATFRSLTDRSKPGPRTAYPNPGNPGSWSAVDQCNHAARGKTPLPMTSIPILKLRGILEPKSAPPDRTQEMPPTNTLYALHQDHLSVSNARNQRTAHAKPPSLLLLEPRKRGPQARRDENQGGEATSYPGRKGEKRGHCSARDGQPKI